MLRVFWVPPEQQNKMLTVISRLLFMMLFASESEFLGLKGQAFGKGGIAKMNFRSSWISYDSRVHFSLFWVALGPIFMTLVALETGLKFDAYSGCFWFHPRSWQRARLVVHSAVPGP